MAQLSGFWTTSDGARSGDQQVSYTQSQLAEAFKIIGGASGFEGVVKSYLTELNASTNDVNNVNIFPGGAMVDGHWFYSDSVVNLTIPSATGAGNSRIDRIVLRCIWGTTFKASLTILTGTAAAKPTPPTITKNSGTTYDLLLWQAKVSTSGTITLTDERVWATPLDTTVVQLKIVTDKTAVSVGSDVLYWTIPLEFAGYIIAHADIAVTVPAVTGNTSIDVLYEGLSVLTSKPSIMSGTKNSYVGTRGQTNDMTVRAGGGLSFDILSAGTGAKGLEVMLVLEK